MTNIVSSRGYNSSYRGSNAPGAYASIGTSDFGAAAPALVNGDLAYNASAGSLAMGTAYVKLTWITAEGESLPSAEASVVVSAASGAVTVTVPAAPTNGAAVLGFRVYSAGTTASEKLQTASNSTTQAQQNFTTTQGVLSGFPISDTTVQILIYGTGASVPTADRSGTQAALPVIPVDDASTTAGGSADYYFVVPNNNSQWKTYKAVDVIRPDSVVEAAGISASFPFDCQAPLYPGATPGTSTYTQVSVAPGVYMVMNGNLFISNQTGSQSTATSFIGSAAFAVTKGTVVTDGSVTWLCLGKAILVHARFLNAGNAVATPVAQAYELFEL